MFWIYALQLIWILPSSWIMAFVVRKKPREVRYAQMRKFCLRIMKTFHVKINIEQVQELDENIPILFISNHQSAFDMLIQMVAIDLPFTFVSKMENKRIPFLGSWSKTLEVLFFDREDRTSGIHMLRESARRLKRKERLLIYPEGTRSKGSRMHTMQAGSLQPAYMAKARIVPMVLENSYEYKQVFTHQGTFTIHLLKPIAYEEYRMMKVEEFTQILQGKMQVLLDPKEKDEF